MNPREKDIEINEYCESDSLRSNSNLNYQQRENQGSSRKSKRSEIASESVTSGQQGASVASKNRMLNKDGKRMEVIKELNETDGHNFRKASYKKGKANFKKGATKLQFANAGRSQMGFGNVDLENGSEFDPS